MRQPDFSENSYGFALTLEISMALGPNIRAAPCFPTLREEGATGGGYDVKLTRPGVPLLIQFKRPDVMVSKAAKEFKKDRLNLDLPFYRMPLRTSGSSRQHDMLLQHCQSGNEVYYACPIFDSEEDFNQHFLNGVVSEHSIFVDPADVGPLSQEPHFLSYSSRHEAWKYSEKPEYVEGDRSKEAMYRNVKEALAKEGDHPVAERMEGYLAGLRTLLGETLGYKFLGEPPADPVDIVRQAATLSRAYLGAELFVAQSTELPTTKSSG